MNDKRLKRILKLKHVIQILINYEYYVRALSTLVLVFMMVIAKW